MKKNIINWSLLFVLTCLYIVFKYNGIMIIANIISILMSMLILTIPLKHKIYALFFFAPMYLYIYIFGFAFYNVITLLTLFNMIIEGKKFDIRIISLVIILFAIDMFWQFYVKELSITYTIKWALSLFLSFTLMLDNKEQYDKNFTIFVYSLGTAIISFGTIIQYIGVDINSVTRAQFEGGLSSLNANTFSFYCLLAMVSGVYLILREDLDKDSIYAKPVFKIFMAVLSFISGVAGAMMLSKAYFLTFILWIILLLLFNIKNKKRFFTCLSAVVFVLLLVGAIPQTRTLVHKVILRFTETGSDLSSITTGRSDIFAMYFKAFAKHPFNALFGAGLSSYQWLFDINFVTETGAPIITHNVILEVICAYGVFGAIILFFIYFKLIKTRVNSSSNLNDLLPLIILIAFSQSLSLYHEDVTNFIIMICMIVAERKVITEEKVVKEEKNRSFYINKLQGVK